MTGQRRNRLPRIFSATIVAVDSYLFKIWVVIEIAKSDTAGEADRLVYHDGLPVVLYIAAIAVVIVVLVVSYNSLADKSSLSGLVGAE